MACLGSCIWTFYWLKYQGFDNLLGIKLTGLEIVGLSSPVFLVVRSLCLRMLIACVLWHLQLFYVPQTLHRDVLELIQDRFGHTFDLY